MNTVGGLIAGESRIDHLVGQGTGFDERMWMFDVYCRLHPGEDFYSATRAVRREIVNRR